MLNVTKVQLWSSGVEDRPGGLLAKLEPLVKTGADLDFLVARGAAGESTDGFVLLSALKGQQQEAVAQQLGLKRNDKLFCLRLEGPDEPGYAYRILFALAAEGMNLREVSAASIHDQFVMFIAFESADEAERAFAKLQRQI